MVASGKRKLAVVKVFLILNFAVLLNGQAVGFVVVVGISQVVDVPCLRTKRGF